MLEIDSFYFRSNNFTKWMNGAVVAEPGNDVNGGL